MSKQLAAELIRNRIVEVREMRLGDIAHNPGNWKDHGDEQLEPLADLLIEIGFAGVPLAYHSERTGVLTFADGHGRKELSPDYVGHVAILDINDEEADMLLMMYDPIAEAAKTNKAKLGDLMKRVNTDKPSLQAFIGTLADKYELFQGGEGGEGGSGGSDGSLLALVDVTIENPKHVVLPGDVWVLGGRHVLICSEIVDGYGAWVPYLVGAIPTEVLFCPYPGPYIGISKKAEKVRLIMVQPDVYVAGHILDRYVDVKGEGSVIKDVE